MAAKTLLKCGYLLKRQRGQSLKADLKKLKFQQRYMNLDTKTLDYFEDQKGVKKGSFPVERIRIVENVPDVTFGRAFCFQVSCVLLIGRWCVHFCVIICHTIYVNRLEMKRRSCISEQNQTKTEKSGWKLSE